MRYKPERALTLITSVIIVPNKFSVEMRYKPERALTLFSYPNVVNYAWANVEMRYKPERALTRL